MPTTDELQAEIDTLTDEINTIKSSMVSINQVLALLKASDKEREYILNALAVLEQKYNQLLERLIALSPAQTTLEAADAFFDASSHYPKTYIYNVDGEMTQINIYSDPGLTNQMYTKNLTYSGENLTSITLTRHSDGEVFTKTLTYTDDLLTRTDLA